MKLFSFVLFLVCSEHRQAAGQGADEDLLVPATQGDMPERSSLQEMARHLPRLEALGLRVTQAGSVRPTHTQRRPAHGAYKVSLASWHSIDLLMALIRSA